MKILQVVPNAGNKSSLKALLKNKERELRGKGTTFTRKREGTWVHERFAGRIHWEEARGGLLIAEIQTKEDGAGWQLLTAFIGYLDRHLSDQIASITITYR